MMNDEVSIKNIVQPGSTRLRVYSIVALSFHNHFNPARFCDNLQKMCPSREEIVLLKALLVVTTGDAVMFYCQVVDTIYYCKTGILRIWTISRKSIPRETQLC